MLKEQIMATNSNMNVLKCGLINIQSVRNKTLLLRDLITEKSYDIFCVTETWLNDVDDACIAEMTPVTHAFHLFPRISRKGEGVGFFILKCFSLIKVFSHPGISSFEHMEIDFKYNDCHFSFIVLYRPPGRNAHMFFEEFDGLLENINTVNKKVIICGDFNFWLDDDADHNTTIFNELLDSHQMLKTVRSETLFWTYTGLSYLRICK